MKDMELFLSCKERLPTRTISDLSVDGVAFCKVVEDAVREVPGQPVESWKVYGETAIPSGRYRVTLENSSKFGPQTMTINNVPGFTVVRIHSGNTEKDTEGCLIIGYELTPEGTIKYGTTRPAVENLKSLVRDAIAEGENVWITIDRTVT